MAYLRHIVRDRLPTPGSGQAMLCFAVMLSAAWFLTFASSGQSYVGLVFGQVLFILLPPLLMTCFLTSDWKSTLRLRWPSWQFWALALGLAVVLHPLANELRVVVERLFPMPKEVASALEAMLGTIPNLPTAILLLAVIPAICEEFAFRGFILSGLQRDYSDRSAIVISAFLFGFLHVLLSLFQQLFNATILGIVLGLLAVRSRSIWPGILFHALNNGFALLLGEVLARPEVGPIIGWLYRDPKQGLYRYPIVALAALVAAILLGLLYRSAPSRRVVTPDPSVSGTLAQTV
jgi:sodium transport system permease protein